MKHTPQPDPNTTHANVSARRSRKRRSPRARAADLQARRQALTFAEVHEAVAPVADEKLPTPSPDVRRDRRRRRALRKSLRPQSIQMWLVLIMVAFVSIGALRKMYIIHADYRWLQARVNEKEEQLAALEEQNERAQHRLAVLTSDKGREQLLIEHGYIPPGSRILLFPPDAAERRVASIPKNDVSPHPPSAQESSRGSIWQHSTKAIGDWWRGLSGTGDAARDKVP